MTSNDKTSDWCVVVSSCDKFSDLWPIFFYFLFRFGLELPQPVYLIANFKYYDDHRVKTLQVGQDRNWSNNNLNSLRHISNQYLLYLQDDYLSSGEIKVQEIDRLVNFLKGQNGTYLCLVNQTMNGVLTPAEGILKIGIDNPWMVHLQAAIWNREKLLHLLHPGQNPWQAESSLNARAKKLQEGFYSIISGHQAVWPYIEAVKGGFWLPEAIEFCRQNNVPVNLRRRPCPPAGNQLTRKMIRSLLKRRMELADLWNSTIGRLVYSNRVLPLVNIDSSFSRV